MLLFRKYCSYLIGFKKFEKSFANEYISNSRAWYVLIYNCTLSNKKEV